MSENIALGNEGKPPIKQSYILMKHGLGMLFGCGLALFAVFLLPALVASFLQLAYTTTEVSAASGTERPPGGRRAFGLADGLLLMAVIAAAPICYPAVKTGLESAPPWRFAGLRTLLGGLLLLLLLPACGRSLWPRREIARKLVPMALLSAATIKLRLLRGVPGRDLLALGAWQLILGAGEIAGRLLILAGVGVAARGTLPPSDRHPTTRTYRRMTATSPAPPRWRGKRPTP
jgi:hypothetical protein